jgi:hypothetical protein
MLASGNQPNQNLTHPKIHTRNKGKFLHKTDQTGSNNRMERKPCHRPPTTTAHNDHLLLLRTTTSKEKSWHRKKSAWLTDRGLDQEIEFMCGKKINKQAMKITSFPE